MALSLVRFKKILSIVGDIIKIEVPAIGEAGLGAVEVRLGDLAMIEDTAALRSVAQVIRIEQEQVSLQVFSGTRGFSTQASVHFLGHPMRVTYSSNILGRVFSGTGEPLDGNSRLEFDPKVPIGVASVNPLRRTVPARMIRTNVPMIDLFNCLVESQKIPIFSIPGEPYNAFLARIGIQADADLVVFAGLGLLFDDYHFFRKTFEDAGVFGRTVMFCNLATAPIVERLITPDLALTVAERFAVEHGKRVLVLLTDMTTYADAMKEIGVALERVPANRGYGGDLYSQLARRYEKACHFSGAGSVTILAVTTMPGNDVTHPVPDNTGYITEGQFYLHGGMLDPFGSLSRLKQHVIGKVTREDHAALANTMIRLYAAAVSAEQKQAMAFDLSPFDLRLLEFGESFRRRFMDINVSMPLEEALDLGWQTLAECFSPEELVIKQSLIDKYFPRAAEVG
ncbi:V-type ATP synthase subunit B [Methylococcus sp. Mc7]|uniref:V-type ATP synthase subunit B n=1 Tax=Methylococcus sp. Mc7 TaxID=2860258 RepID=UPI001C52EF9A|nr:V-type ATP synthase subunit B [Methylococcus sp. Mc7]QXP83356.1 V-type ATP synthase subunit B [Methylococcus sp. Mc7]